jgi:hypothetical protein
MRVERRSLHTRTRIIAARTRIVGLTDVSKLLVTRLENFHMTKKEKKNQHWAFRVNE